MIKKTANATIIKVLYNLLLLNIPRDRSSVVRNVIIIKSCHLMSKLACSLASQREIALSRTFSANQEGKPPRDWIEIAGNIREAGSISNAEGNVTNMRARNNENKGKSALFRKLKISVLDNAGYSDLGFPESQPHL